MRIIVGLIICFLEICAAEEWLFSGLVRVTVSPTDYGIARVFDIPIELTYQSKIWFSTKFVKPNRVKITFTKTETRYLVNNILETPDFNLSDNLITRRILLERENANLKFYDDPDNMLAEEISFDPNLMCLMVSLILSSEKPTNTADKEEKLGELVWSMPYTNQNHFHILERLTANLSQGLGENQAFSFTINRDETLRNNKTYITGMADGLGDGMISRHNDGGTFMVNAAMHLERSLLVKENDHEGRLSIIEEHDFILEPKQ